MRFYGAGDDLLNVSMLVLQHTDCSLYEADSEVDQPLRHLNAGSIEQWIKRKRSATWNFGLAAWSPAMEQAVAIRTVQLQTRTGGSRQVAEGWGLIWLRLVDVRDGRLGPSDVATNSEARARQWAKTNPDLGAVEAWDWHEVTRVRRRIERLIRSRLAVGRNGGLPVLTGAQNAFVSGIKPSPL